MQMLAIFEYRTYTIRAAGGAIPVFSGQEALNTAMMVLEGQMYNGFHRPGKAAYFSYSHKRSFTTQMK